MYNPYIFCHSILYIFDNIIYTIYLCVCRWISGFNQVELELIQHHQTNNRMWYENVMKQFYNIASILLNQWRRTEIERGGARLSSPSPVPTYMWMTAVFQCLHRNHYLQLFAFNILKMIFVNYHWIFYLNSNKSEIYSTLLSFSINHNQSSKNEIKLVNTLWLI